MSEERKNASTWAVVLLIGMPMLYVLSSGPAQMAACDTVYLPDTTPPHSVKISVPGPDWFMSAMLSYARWWMDLG